VLAESRTSLQAHDAEQLPGWGTRIAAHQEAGAGRQPHAQAMGGPAVQLLQLLHLAAGDKQAAQHAR